MWGSSPNNMTVCNLLSATFVRFWFSFYSHHDNIIVNWDDFEEQCVLLNWISFCSYLRWCLCIWHLGLCADQEQNPASASRQIIPSQCKSEVSKAEQLCARGLCKAGCGAASFAMKHSSLQGSDVQGAVKTCCQAKRLHGIRNPAVAHRCASRV